MEATILNVDVTSVMTHNEGVRPYNRFVDFRPSEHPKKCLVVALALVSAQIVLSVVLPRSFALAAFGDLTQCLLLTAAFLAIFSNVPVSRGWTRFFWSLLSFGVCMWLSAQVLWTYFEVFQRQDVPNPFVGDIIFFLHIVPMMAALAVQPHTQRDEHSVRFNLLDFLLLLVWWLFLYLFLVVAWQYVYQSDEVYARCFNVLYMAEHLAFLSFLALAWRRSVDGWRTIYQQLFGASLLYAIGSVEASMAIDRHIYYTGSIFDVPLVAAMAWFAYIGLRARRLARDGQFQKRPAPRPGIWTGRLAMLTVFSTPLMVAWALFGGHAPDSVRKYRVLLTIGTMLVMGLLVFLKQRFLDRELMQLLQESNQNLEDVRELKDDLVQKESLLRAQSLELQRKNLELQEASYTDAMTGLWNRRYLEETLAAESGQVLRSYQRAEHDGGPQSTIAVEHRDLVFIMVDIDWFKRVNDDHGHTVGDTLLRAVAKRLSRIMRKSDVLIRWGGEEFMILTRSSDRSEIAIFCSRILDAIGSAPFDLGGGIEIHKTCSIGWAPYPWAQGAYDAVCGEEVIELADTALYLAKAMGRNQGAGFVPSDQALAAPKRVTIENLRQKNSDLIKVIRTPGAGKIEGLKAHEDVGIKTS